MASRRHFFRTFGIGSASLALPVTIGDKSDGKYLKQKDDIENQLSQNARDIFNLQHKESLLTNLHWDGI